MSIAKSNQESPLEKTLAALRTGCRPSFETESLAALTGPAHYMRWVADYHSMRWHILDDHTSRSDHGELTNGGPRQYDCGSPQ